MAIVVITDSYSESFSQWKILWKVSGGKQKYQRHACILIKGLSFNLFSLNCFSNPVHPSKRVHVEQSLARQPLGPFFVWVCFLFLRCSRFPIPSSHSEVKMGGKVFYSLPLNFLRWGKAHLPVQEYQRSNAAWLIRWEYSTLLLLSF